MAARARAANLESRCRATRSLHSGKGVKRVTVAELVSVLQSCPPEATVALRKGNEDCAPPRVLKAEEISLYHCHVQSLDCVLLGWSPAEYERKLYRQ